MSFAEVLAEIPTFTHQQRQELMRRVSELDLPDPVRPRERIVAPLIQGVPGEVVVPSKEELDAAHFGE